MTTSDDGSIVYIYLASAMTVGLDYEVEVNNVQDLAGNDIDTGDNSGSVTYVPPHGKTLDLSKVSDTTGKITIDAGATSYPTGNDWSQDSGQFFITPEGVPLSQSSVIASAYIESDGSSNPIYLEDFVSGDDKVFDNGAYDIYIMFYYDANEGVGTPDYVMSFSEPFSYTVTSGL